MKSSVKVIMSCDRKSKSLTYLILSFASAHVAGSTWYEFEGHCYIYPDVRDSFSNSKLTCQKNGAYVVELGGTAELKFVQSLISGSSDQFWVGLDYNNTTKNYSWSQDGHKPLPSMWLQSEPNYSGFCVRLATGTQAGAAPGSSDTTYLLGDNPCSSAYRVICEKETDILNATSYREVAVSSTNICPVMPFLARSKIHCGFMCSISRQQCRGFQYDLATKNCTMYMSSATCSRTLGPKVTLYSLQSVRC